jgi:hypothetical protein
LAKETLLSQIVRGLHLAIGITAPPPEQAWIYALVWLGVWLVIVATFLLLFVGIHYQWF